MGGALGSFNQDTAIALLEDTLSGVAFGMALLDEDLKFLLFNEKYVEMAFGDTMTPKVGESAAALSVVQLQSGFFKIPEGLDPESMSHALVEAVTSCASEIPLERADGVSLVASSKRTALGGYLISITDVTDRRRAEAAEADRWAAITSAFDALEEGASLWDADFRFVMCNDNYMEMVAPYRDTRFEVGRPAEELIAEAYRSGLYELDEELTEDAFVQSYLHWAKSHAGPMEVRLKSGRVIIASAKETDLGGVLVTTVDVTEERNTEDRARDMLAVAMEALEEGFALWDADKRFVMCNQKYVDYVLPFRDGPFEIGTTIAEGGRQILDAGILQIPEGLTEDDMIADVEAWVDDFGAPREYHFKDGRVLVMKVKPTDLGGFLVTAVDVTKQQDAEKNRLAAVNDALDAVDNPLALFSAGRRFVLGNKAWKDMVAGYAEPVPEDTADSLFARLIDSDFYNLPEGVTAEDFMREGLAAMDDLVTDYPLSLADGTRQLANVRKTGLDGFLISYRDVTDQIAMETELERQRESTHQNEKLSALGELLAGVAHELNNPLSVVFGYSQMLQGKIEDPVLSERIDLICQSSERAAKIVRTFLAMARQRPTKMEPCALNDIIQTALEVSSYSLKSNGTDVQVDLGASAPFVVGDFDQLAQVFSNLIINAGHAVKDKGAAGRITLQSKLENGHVVIEIADNGKGIPDKVLGRIFEPFFTTKDVGEGTGIGLTFSHRIIKSHDGDLTVTSKLGAGTRFFVRLDAAEPDATPDAPCEAPVLNGHSVLVVDDEEGVAQLVTDMLRDEGFTVTKTTDARTALRMVEAASFDTILSDFKMPEMNGAAFYSALRTLSPAHADVTGFITGDAMSDDVVRFFATSGRPHIEKPIIRDELLALIQSVSGEELP